MNGHEWNGSTDPAVKSGIATFYDRKVSMSLESFTDFQAICKMLNQAYVDGMQEGAREVAYAAQEAYKSMRMK